MAEGKLLGTFYADAVIGKQEYIGYALALDAAGRVLRLDILEYRETHGWEIRNERWRAQFTGKTAADPVEVSRDIGNVSGATLSCRHVTDGVRRLLALNALLARR
jgi:Na+-translocating ferredoxin:NAD+ oxidoreductase RnfG subunit